LLNRKAIIVLASDFEDQNFEKQHKITSRKHDLVNLIIRDRLEEELPDFGIVPLRDAETGKQVVIDTSDKKVRVEFKKKVFKRKKELDNYFVKNKMDFVDIYTNESYVRPLTNFFRKRINRY
jgi:hypothetical protein